MKASPRKHASTAACTVGGNALALCCKSPLCGSTAVLNAGTDDGIQANAGVDYRVAGSDNVGVAYSYRQRVAAGGAAQGEVTAYEAHKFNDRLRVQGHATGGTSNGSPDWGIGTSVNYTF